MFMVLNRRNCATYFQHSRLGGLLGGGGTRLVACLGLPPCLFADITLMLGDWLHLACQLLLGLCLPSYKLYHRELRARAQFLARQPGSRCVWLAGSSNAGSSRRASLELR